MSEPTRSQRFDRPTVGRAALGGGLGGLVGAIIFGVVLWLSDPNLVAASIPEFYGLAHSAFAGWVFHLVHGILIGIVFGLIASRPVVFGIVTGPVATDILEGLSASTRFGLVGVVFGIAIWTAVPFIGLSLLGAIADLGAPGFTHLAAEMVLGHVLFGVIVGIVFSLFVPTHTRALEQAEGRRKASG